MNHPIVCLTIDFDALSLWLAKGLSTATPLSRGEFGVVGARRLLALLAKKSIRATWFIPGHTIETFPDVCREIHTAGHEIGHHGWTHTAPAALSLDEEISELDRGNEAIKGITGQYATGYRSPSWDLSDNTVDLLISRGFKYESSMMGNDYMPYRVRVGDHTPEHEPATFGALSDLIEMPVSWSLDDFPHFEYFRAGPAFVPGLQNASNVLENWYEDFLYLKESIDWGVITYTLHPFVIGRGHRMRMLEKLIDRLSSDGARFLPMREAAELASSRI